MRRSRGRDRLAAGLAAARRRRRERTVRRAAAAAVVVLALWLAVRVAAGAGTADYTAGVITGVAAGVLPGALRRPVERWARTAGVSARAAAARPVPRTPRPARTPIHDTAEHAQKGTW